jgi:hypothetical protein
MPPLNTRNQCIFVAVYAACILFVACAMSSDQRQDTNRDGYTKSERFVCVSCEKRNQPCFFMDKRSCKIHISKTNRCKGSVVKKVNIMTRPGDLIAGGTSAMGPCPNAQHQPPGILSRYIRNMSGISLIYLWYIYEIFMKYSRYITCTFLRYIRNITDISLIYFKHIQQISLSQTF